ncbi:MAG: hypothetical protein HQL53_04555 [Magnetococcales bacterium]|nr:hypothetical protein [Magnetococcales bacterium]
MFELIRVVFLGVFGGAAMGMGAALPRGERAHPLGPVRHKESGNSQPGASQKEQVRFVGETLYEESQPILTHEEIPLDNRKGTTTLQSEHTLIRTVETALELEKEEELEKKIGMGLLKLVEGEFKRQVAFELGLRLDTKVTKRVSLRCSAKPGEFARFQVAWKQDIRRGVFSVEIGEVLYRFPFQATCGLSYSVERLGDGGPFVSQKQSVAESAVG